MLVSCTDKKETSDDHPNYDDAAQLSQFANKVAGDEYKYVTYENFNSDTLKEIVVGREIESGETWGIKFTFYEVGKSNRSEYSTILLEGSFSGATVTPMKIAGNDNQLLYYDSGDFFLGSAGGEIFTHIIDFENKKVHSATLVLDRADEAKLTIKTDGEEEIIKNYFISFFKRDYPDLIVSLSDAEEKNE